MFNIHQTCRQTKGLKVITAPFPSPSFIWTFKSYFIITLVSLSLMYRPWETCLLASDSFVRYLCAIWCLGCTGKVFLCGASRQPPSLWNHISNILFRALTGHIFIARSSYGSLAPSRDSSKWSKMPQWHPAFFLLTEKPLSFCGESSLSLTQRPGQVSVEQRGWRQSGTPALSVLSGPTISELTCAAHISYTFWFPDLPLFKQDSELLFIFESNSSGL